MIRTRVKGNGKKAASSPTTEPNFYAMEPCPESAQSIPHYYDACARDHSTPCASDATLTASNSTLNVEQLPFAMDITTLPDPFCQMDSFIPRLSRTDEPHIVVSHPSSPRDPKICFTNSLTSSHLSFRIQSESLGSTLSLPLKNPLDFEQIILEDCDEDSFSHSMEANFVSSDSKAIRDGDELFVEGLKFTFLDHLEKDDF